MAETGRSRISDGQIKQLKVALKESANKYDELLDHISNFQREEDRLRKNEIENVICDELKNTHSLCLTLQRELEVLEHKHRQASKSADGSKKNVSAFAADFRLTPEEQDIAYEFKAHVMRKIHSQNQNIKKELEFHEKKIDLEKCQQAFKKHVEEQMKSQSTLKYLLASYEKKAGNDIKQCQAYADEVEHLKASLRLAEVDRDYHAELFIKQGGDPFMLTHPASHQTVRSSDMEALESQNKALKKEILLLRAENERLMKSEVKVPKEVDESLKKHHERQMLAESLKEVSRTNKLLQSTATRQAAKWVQGIKGARQYEHEERKKQIVSLSPLAADERLYQYSVKKNVDKPRQTIFT